MSDTEKLSNYTAIIARLRAVRTREENVALATGTLRAFTVVTAIILVALAVEAVFHLETTGRTALALATLVAIGIAKGRLAVPALLRRMGILAHKSDDNVALQVGRHVPQLQDRLLNALQLVRDTMGAARPTWSLALVDAGFSDVATRFATVDMRPVVDVTPLRRASRRALALAVVAVLGFTAMPTTLAGAAWRIINFRTDFAPPAPFDFIVKPGDVDVVKGQQVVLAARTTSPDQPAIRFHIREASQTDFDVAPAAADSAGLYTHRIAAIRTSLVYYAEAEGYRSRMYEIRVTDRPVIRSLRARLTFPAYTKLPARVLDENAGDVSAPVGTTVGLSLSLNKDVARATIVFDDSQRVALSVQGASASGSFRVMRDRRYHVELVDAAGITNADPITYAISAVPDEGPRIELVEPDVSADLDESMREVLLVRIADDYGFSKLVLHYRLAASKYEKPQEKYATLAIPLPVAQSREMEVPYLWNLTSLSLVPEDVVAYYVEVFDNNTVTGPRSARSAEHTLRLPSLEEVFAKADRTQDKALDDLEKTMQAAEEARRALESVQREMKQQNTDKLDWQQKKKLEEVLKRHEQMQEQVRQTAESLSKMNEEMREQNLISEETLQKYQELQNLMKQVDAPELREAMKKLNEAMQQMQPEQMRQAMEKFEFSEQQFRESIERTMELFKRIQIEMKTEELTKRAEDLARRQEELARQTEQTNPSNKDELNRLAEQQKQLAKDAEAMQRELDELQKKMAEMPPQEMPMQEMSDAQQQLSEANLSQEMNEASEMCEGGQCQSASKKQKKAADQMKKFAQQMQKVQKKLNENQQKMTQQALQKALDNVLELSKKQESLRNQSQRLQPSSQQFREMTQRQQQIGQELAQTANDIMELSKKSFAVTPKMGQHLGEALKKMSEATKSMQNRDNRMGGEQQGGAMTELNESAKQISKSMQSQKSGGGGGGGSMMQQLRQMAQSQQSLNAMTQQMGQQQGMSQQQMAQMQRMAAQQGALQKSLEQLNEEAKRSEEGRRILGDLRRIAEEMQEVVRDMQSGNVNPETIDKQERILSRLLDASRSTRERDWEKKRRSQTGTDVARRSPGSLDPRLTDPSQAGRSDVQRAVSEGYSREYEQLIRQYFEALGKVK